MEYIIGLTLALGIAGMATIVGLDRDRSFYPAVVMAVATYYVLFAAMGASGRILVIEIIVASGFILVALIGFKGSSWFVAAALVGHGVFDAVHHLFIQNPGMPHWWPGFCGTFDVVAGGWLAVRLMRHSDLSLHNDAPTQRPG